MEEITLVGSVTGANYAVIAGAAGRLYELGVIPKRLIGVSGSTIPLAFLANGGTPHNFCEIAKKFPAINLIRPNWSLLWTPGAFHLDKLVEELLPYVPRFFRDCKIPLTVVALDSDTGDALHFSDELTPGIEVARAVQASSSIPWIMRHTSIGGVRATDGGSVNSFPIDLGEGLTIGIRVIGARSEPRRWRWWSSYSWNHVDAMLRAQERAHISRALWDSTRIITVKSPISSLDFHKVDEGMVNQLYELGYTAADKKISDSWISG